MLTEKQEKYIQELLKGKSQRKAYREAYPSSRKWKDHTVDVKASELLKHGKVLARFTALRDQREQEHKEKALYTLEEAINDLKDIKDLAHKDILKNGFRQANSTAFINAAKELIELEALGKERSVKIAKMEAETGKIKGTADEIEDMSSIYEEIYGN